MRVLLLGAGGAMGEVAARLIADLDGVTDLGLADNNPDALERVRHQTVDSVDRAANADSATAATRVSADVVDVTDQATLRAAIDNHDLVVNCVGPFYRFAVPILTATIAAGRDYIDICDDWEPTVEMLALDADARAAGSVCIIGMGASPGVSNMLAAMATAKLDLVEDLFTAWPVDVGESDEIEPASAGSARSTPDAATVHWMQQLSGEIQLVECGQLVARPLLQPISLDVPGHGAGTVHTVGHPEPITLLRSQNVQGRCANTMVVTAGTVAFLDDLRRKIDAGSLTLEQAAANVHAPTARQVGSAAVRSVGKPGPGKLPPFFALATGRRGDRRVTVAATAHLSGGMAAATASPLAAVVGQLAKTTLTPTPGVHAPEDVIDPGQFFAAFDRYVDGGARATTQERIEGPA